MHRCDLGEIMRYIIFIVMFFAGSLLAVDREMKPYLQTPTPTSIYVSWLGSSSEESTVQYGLTTNLGTTSTGSVYTFASDLKWHSVKLQNLKPNTHYYYKCITGNQQTNLCSFTTAPTRDIPNAHLRILFMGDTRTNTNDLINLLNSVQSKMYELYGSNWRQEINLLCHVGDLATWAGQPDQFADQYFYPFSVLSSSIPIMVATGNHEAESPNYYNYIKTEDIAGPEGKIYFSFSLGDARFIFMNSNTKGSTQLNWISNQLNEAANNDSIDFIFGVLHHFGHSEMRTVDNLNWVQYNVIPLFASQAKPNMLPYGHAHCYERGTSPNGRTRLMCCGGGSAPPDHWTNDGTQVDYPEIHYARDCWLYSIVDIDMEHRTYTERTFSTGNANAPLNNIQIDNWNQTYDLVNYDAKAISAKVLDGGNVELISAPSIPYDDFNLMSSEIQLSSNNNFTSNILDIVRNWMDVYRDTGAPNYQPIDWNHDLNLLRYHDVVNGMQSGQTYYWRIRYRSQNADWGQWSQSQQFVNSVSPISADFSYTGSTIQNIPIQFVDTSAGDVTSWAWDFDNDGIIDSRASEPLWTFSSLGMKEVKLTTTINGIAYSCIKAINIQTSSLPNPANLKIKVRDNDVYLSWDPVPGASFYHVFSYNSPGLGTETSLRTINCTSVMLPNQAEDKHKFFRVIPVP